VRATRGDGVPVVVSGVTTRSIWRPGEPDHRAKLRRLTRRWITLTESRGSEGGRLWAACLTWTGNREGTTAWRGSAEHCEGVDGAAAQGPCDMAKTGLFEAQFPGMEMCILRHITPGAEPPVSGESPLLRPNPSGWWTVGSELTQGNGQAAYVTLDTSSARGIRDRLRGASPKVTECR
jgi:hypothetical protein